MNFFLVESPLQYLNALEAKYKFEIIDEKSVLIILDGVSQKNFEQIKKLVDINRWNEIFYFRNSISKILRYLNLIQTKKILKIYNDNDRVFIGEYRSDLMRDFINQGKFNEKYLLDDGTASLMVHKLINNKIGYTLKLTKLRRWLNSLFGLKDDDIYSLNFFTIYNSKGPRKVIKNDYEFIKSKIKSFQKLSEVYFLGNNTPELGIVDSKYYLEKVEQLRNRYKDQKIRYVPHRRESQKKLDIIQDKIGLSITDFDLPIEWAIIRSGELPKEIISFQSSALDNCYKIFGEQIEIKAFKMDPKLIAEKNRKAFNYVFENYSNYGPNFEIIEL